MIRFLVAAGAAWAAFALSAVEAFGQAPYERPPVEYATAPANDRAAELQRRLDAGETSLRYDREHGYLPAVLAALGVPVESQVLVFSKTSLQRERIAPRRPRAVYFSDDAYVGYCQHGQVLEVAAADPELGLVFYTVDQSPEGRPHFTRQGDNCLICHSSARTEDVPGLLARSLAVSRSGEPILSAGSIAVDHRTPLAERWGGWYVTGDVGPNKHRGNRLTLAGAPPQEFPPAAATEAAAHEEEIDLRRQARVERYLSPHSDVVALMVLEHQLLVQNRLTRANFETRSALYYQAEMNQALGQPADAPLDSVERRIAGAGEALVEALLLVDEAPLAGPLRGTSGFAEKFAGRGPRSRTGRSLREFDLQRRMFRYPCSYLIQSPAFAALPQEVRTYVWRRLGDVVSGRDASPAFQHLSAEDRRAVAEILRTTTDDLPADWPG